MSNKKEKILIVDDDRRLSEILANVLDYEGYDCDTSNDGEETISKFKKKTFDLVLLDLKLPDMSGMDILSKIKKLKPSVQIVMISGQGSIQTAVEATKKGAYDFLEKPLDTERVLVTIKNALEKGRLEREKALLLESEKRRYAMVGKSKAMEEINEFVEKAASTTSKVLIEGENGTGKELVARAIHHSSSRAGERFLAVNCAAIPDSLIESELFGHKKGAFTNAFEDKIGKFQAADGGTLFLDEIGDMSLFTQSKVLRALEEGTIEMIGDDKSIKIDVRIIAATNKDLQKEIDSGKFRKDLYFRLNVLNIKIPPLRERKEDIPLLIEHFINQYSHEHGVPPKRVTEEGIQLLQNYSWPGNIRELKNLAEELMVIVEEEEINPKMVASVLRKSSNLRLYTYISSDMSLQEAREQFEREFIHQKLIMNNWNITRTAKMLGIPRTYLHNKINKFKLRSKN